MERPTVLSKRVGVILREAREKRKLSVREVARETNITAKYVEALENEDFSQFPGETYAFGFLRNYVEFLNMDVDHILNTYKGQQMDQSPTPVKELVGGVTSSISFQFPIIEKKYYVYAVVVVCCVLLISLFSTGALSFPSFVSSNANTVVSQSVCKGKDIQDFSLPAAGSGLRGVFLDDKSALRFTADRHRIKLCLVSVSKSSSNSAVAKLSILVDSEATWEFEVKERETYLLTNKVAGLSGLARKILIRPTALADYTAQIEFSTLADQSEARVEQQESSKSETQEATVAQQNSGTGLIQVTLEFIQPSYISWVTDGQSHAGRTLNQGQTITLEAQNRLEVKIGNGGGVRVRRDGVVAKIAGRPAQIVSLTYSMVPDPLDPGVKKIQETKR